MQPYYEQDGIVIFHGDCRDILPTLEPGSIDLVLTDPPYGIGLENHAATADLWDKRYGSGGRKRESYDWTIAGDADQSVGITILDATASLPQIVFASPMKPWPGKWRQHLVWDKGGAVGGGGDIATCWKFTWDLIQVRNTKALNGSRDSAVLKFWTTQAGYHDHPNQKPESLMRYLVSKASQEGDTILDPFMGSGTTLRAAKDLGRKAIGIEIEERYCEIAAKRLQQAVLPLEAFA